MTLRWVVHGTDVVTGEAVTLGVAQGEATEAVQAALSRRMIVSHVRSGRWGQWGRALMGAACVGVVALSGIMWVLWKVESTERVELGAARGEAARWSAVAAEEEAVMKRMEESGASRATIAALDAATQRVSGLEAQLKAARAAGEGKQAAEGKVVLLTAKLREAQGEQGKLAEEMTRRGAEAAGAVERARVAEAEVAGLMEEKKAAGAEVEVLKGELLAAAARPSEGVVEKAEAEVVTGGAARWALKVGYAAASEFVAMRFEKDSMATAALGDGEMEWTATASANAARVRVVYDKAKERVFGASLSVGLAADGPAGKVAENRELVREFLKAFAPGVKAEWVDRAIVQLAGRESGERMVMVAEDAKVSVWNNGVGLYTWKVESVGNEME